MKSDNSAPLFGALLLLLMLSGLDQTLLGTMLPSIAAALGHAELAPWLFSTYLTAATIAVPVYGKLADRHGPWPMLLTAALLFTIGSALCAAAPTMPMLVVARAVQGSGGGGLMTLAVLSTAWLYPPADRGRRMGLIGAAYSLSTLVGPLAGGMLASLWPWQVAFLINLPCAALAVGIIARHRFGRGAAKPAAFDAVGTAWLAGALAALLWTTRQPLGSTEGMVAAAASAVLVVGWYLSARRATDPVVPLGLFRDRAFTAAAGLAALSGVVLFSTVVYASLYLQNGLRLDAFGTGVHTLPLMLGITIAAQLVGRALRSGRSPVGLTLAAGTLLVVGTAGAAAVLQVAPARSWGLSAALLPIGLGLGVCFPLTALVAQRRAPASQLGAASALPMMLRSLGGAWAVALLGEGLRAHLAGASPAAMPQAMAAGAGGIFLWLTAASLAVLPLASRLSQGFSAPGADGPHGRPPLGSPS